MKTKHLTSLLLLFACINALAQQEIDFNLFNGAGELRSVYVQRHRLNEKYNINLDAGSYLGLGNNVWTRWGFRGNVQRLLSTNYSFDIGFMYNNTKLSNVTKHEYRPHQAFHISYPRFKSSTLKHRFRLEERIFTSSNDKAHEFKMRLRYRVFHQGRFNGQTVEPKSFYYRAFAEFSFNMYNEAEDLFFIRGRYCAGYGYQFNSKLSADVNYFFEHNRVAAGADQNIIHIIQFTLRQTLYWKN